MLNLIIVDDDETLLEGLSTAVDWETLGYRVSGTARNGKEALQVLETRSCDVLLTDIRMGQMDGLRLTEEISKRFADVRVVIMSAYDDFRYAQQAIRLGVDDYLLKPIDIKQLHAVMNKLSQTIQARRLQEQRYHALKQRVEELGDQATEKYARTSGALNVGLCEYLCKAVLLGNAESVQKNMLRLREHVQSAGDGSFLFTVSAINLLAVRLEASGELTEKQAKRLQASRRAALLCGRSEEALDGVCALLEAITEEKAAEAGDISSIILRARAYVDAHFGESALRIREVAAHVGLSASYFSTMFAKHVGESFSDYLTGVRMREAQLLLSNTSLRTYEIAARVGYDNPAYFSTLFKKYTGMTISQYRKAFQNGY